MLTLETLSFIVFALYCKKECPYPSPPLEGPLVAFFFVGNSKPPRLCGGDLSNSCVCKALKGWLCSPRFAEAKQKREERGKKTSLWSGSRGNVGLQLGFWLDFHWATQYRGSERQTESERPFKLQPDVRTSKLCVQWPAAFENVQLCSQFCQ